jgi:hypothetical protein
MRRPWSVHGDTGTYRNLAQPAQGREPSETEDSGAQPSPRSRTQSEETQRVQNLRRERITNAASAPRTLRRAHHESSHHTKSHPELTAPYRTKTSPHRSRARLRFRAHGTTPPRPHAQEAEQRTQETSLPTPRDGGRGNQKRANLFSNLVRT